jgi:drug/metabolite transporter (DMT)-like permease
MNTPKVCYALMTGLVCLWGFEYIVAKQALEVFAPLTLVFFKYFTGLFVLLPIKLMRDRRLSIRKKDIPLLVLCSLFGEIIYYFAEYQALSYISVAVVTIILSFVPMLSLLIEAVLFHKRPTAIMVGGVVVCVAGIALVIGVDFRQFQGGAVGYLLAFVAVLAWNVYNFTTERLTPHYTNLDLALLQLICSALLSAPYMCGHLPKAADLTPQAVGGVIYLGIAVAAVGFFVYVKAISVLGPTPCALYSNFMPITAAFFGWVLLGEKLTALQIVGCVVVIASASLVIYQKSRQERLLLEEEKKERIGGES